MKDTISDIAKTLFPNGVVLGIVNGTDLKTDLEILLLLLSIVYTVLRIATLRRKNGRLEIEDPGDER